MLPDRAVDLRRMAAAAARPPVLVWSDAMWEEASPRSPAHGGIGFVVWLPPDHPMSPAPAAASSTAGSGPRSPMSRGGLATTTLL
eukprot:4377078-Prymnesium_polylepis.1